VRLLWIALALALAASASGAFPYVPGNTVKRGRSYLACDTVTAPAGPTGRTRTIYLISGTAVGADSVLNVWRNVGTVPTFRRIQATRWTTNDANGSLVIVTIYRDGATSAMNRIFVTPFQWMEFPVEADSIVFRSANGSTAPIVYCAW
jgi:hypothetical protein